MKENILKFKEIDFKKELISFFNKKEITSKIIQKIFSYSNSLIIEILTIDESIKKELDYYIIDANKLIVFIFKIKNIYSKNELEIILDNELKKHNLSKEIKTKIEDYIFFDNNDSTIVSVDDEVLYIFFEQLKINEIIKWYKQ